MLDRKLSPTSSELGELNYSKPESTLFDNGNSLHCIIREDSNVAKIEIQYDAGLIYQPISLIANCVNAVLLEGTKKMSSKEIAEYFDGEGAFLEHNCSAEKASVILYCLKRSVRKTALKLLEILDNASFEQKEIDNYLKIKKQKFLVDCEKMSFVARNNFLNVLIGENNSYSAKTVEQDFEQVKREDLLEFYKTKYVQGVKQIFISGGIERQDLKIFQDYLANCNTRINEEVALNFEINPSKENQLLLTNETAIQTAIRIGVTTFGKNDPRFPHLFILNTILGGYFGSRLMKNIREDKGYTYGVGSGLVNYKHLSYLIIVTEVGTDYTHNTLTEINKEIERLQQEEISESELNLVKNYILGNLLRGFDGAYESMDRFKGLFNFGLDYTYYEDFVKKVGSANGLDIIDLANEVLRKSEFKQVLAGNL